MSPNTIRKTSGIAFGVVAMALLVISAMGYRTAQRSTEANQSVAPTYEVLNALERVSTTMVDAETGVRGFAIAGRRDYLEPFSRAHADFVSHVDAVATLTADNPVQQRYVSDLRTETSTTIDLLQQIVSRAESHESSAADLNDREKASMNAVRATLQRMRVEEHQLMENRIQDAANANVRTRALMVGLIAAALGALAVSFFFVDRRAVQLRDANDALTERVQARTAELECALASEKTARQQAEHARQRFKQVIEGAPVAMIAVDRRGMVVLANALAEQLFGYRHDELVGIPVEKLVPERVRPNHARYRQDFSDAPQMRQMGAGRDLYATRRDGSEIPVEIGLNPIDLDGETVVLGSIVDNTERKRLLVAEQRARAEADAANRSKDVFLARVSHELRTPLNALMGWARMLREGRLATAKVPHAIVSIDRNAEVLKTLVDDLVEMSRVTTGKLHIDRRHTDLNPVLRESASLLEPAANDKDIKIETAIEPIPIVVDGDPTRLRQVFWNLLSNAIKFTPTGGRVALRVCRMDGEVEVSVTDSGHGIAPDFLPHVFEPFAQAESGGQGLGLGLAIAHQLVQAHDGRIKVTSPGVDGGATFTVILPMAGVSQST